MYMNFVPCFLDTKIITDIGEMLQGYVIFCIREKVGQYKSVIT